MNKIINLGILGAGSVFRNMHLPAILKHPKLFKIVSVYDPNPAAIALTKKQLARTSVNFTASPSEIFKNPALDAVAVLTPTEFHVNYTIQSLKNRKHVFLEKPAAVKANEVKKIILAEKKYRKRVQVGMVLRYSSFYKEILKIIGSRKFGKVLWMNWLETRPFDPANWRYSDSAKNGDAIIHDKAVHQINLFNAFAGSKPKQVAAFGGQFLLSNHKYKKLRAFNNEASLKGDSNDHLFAMINYKNGVKASLTVSYVSPHARESRWVIQLENARIIAHFETFVDVVNNGRRKWKSNPSAIYLFADKKNIKVPWKYPMSYPPSGKNLVFYDEYKDEPMHPGSTEQWKAFYVVAAKNSPPKCGTNIALADALLVDAIAASVKTNKMIKLN